MVAMITACDAAASEACPPWTGRPILARWAVPDPVAALADIQEEAFARAQEILSLRACPQLDLPFETMTRAELSSALADMGGAVRGFAMPRRKITLAFR